MLNCRCRYARVPTFARIRASLVSLWLLHVEFLDISYGILDSSLVPDKEGYLNPSTDERALDISEFVVGLDD